MAATCPVCGGRIPFYKAQGQVWCASCGAELSAPDFAPLFLLMILWTIVDALIAVAVSMGFEGLERDGMREFIRVLLSAGAGIGLYWLIYSNVKIKATGRRRNDAS
jgi:hypothetical protein